MDHPLRCTLKELSGAIRAKRLSPVELMAATLERIDATHDHLNAIVARRDQEELVAEARRAEDRAARRQARPLQRTPLGCPARAEPAWLHTSQRSLCFCHHRPSPNPIQGPTLTRS